MSDLLDPLWASTLDRIDLDLPRHSVVIEAHAVDQGTTTRYQLECAGMTDFYYANEDFNVEPWAYASIEEAELTEMSDGRVQVRLELWIPEWTLTVTATDVQLRTCSSA